MMVHEAQPEWIAAQLLPCSEIVTKRPLANEQLECSAGSPFAPVLGSRSNQGRAQLFDAGFTWDDAWRVLVHVAARRGFMPSVEISDVTVPA